jgi:hypothetical protein
MESIQHQLSAGIELAKLIENPPQKNEAGAPTIKLLGNGWTDRRRLRGLEKPSTLRGDRVPIPLHIVWFWSHGNSVGRLDVNQIGAHQSILQKRSQGPSYFVGGLIREQAAIVNRPHALGAKRRPGRWIGSATEFRHRSLSVWVVSMAVYGSAPVRTKAWL